MSRTVPLARRNLLAEPRRLVPKAFATRRASSTYGDGDLAVHAVNDIDLDVGRGEVILIMGPSGSDGRRPQRRDGEPR